MADKEGNVLAKDYGIGIAPPERPFPVKGHASAGWGMQSRLGQILLMTAALLCWLLTMVILWALPQVWNVLI